MKIEEFALGDSFIHSLDPRAKIVAAFSFSLVVALTHSIPASVLGIIFSIVLVMAARLSLRRVLARLAVVNGFILFLWFFLPFTYPGEVMLTAGPLAIHREGVLYALLITFKSNAIILAVMALLGTSPIFTLVHALSHMGVPDKLVHLFFFSFRYLHLIHDEYHRLVRAMKIRGFRPGTNVHTYRSYAYLVGMLLVRSFDRARRILAAMKCRGFKKKFYILHHYEMKKSDYLVAAACVLLSVMLLGV
jgi:cobalt/nickel transport system permease protein